MLLKLLDFVKIVCSLQIIYDMQMSDNIVQENETIVFLLVYRVTIVLLLVPLLKI